MASLVIVVSAVLVLSCGQTDRQTDRQTDTQTTKKKHQIVKNMCTNPAYVLIVTVCSVDR